MQHNATTKPPKAQQNSNLGKIPEGWSMQAIKELTTKIGDGLHSTPKYSDNTEYYFVNGNNLIDNKIVINENTKCVSEKEYLKHKKMLDSSTLLLSINGTIGNIAFYDNEKVVLGKSAAYLNIDKTYSKEYLAYQLQTHKISNLFKRVSTGSTIKNLGLKEIQKIKLPIPPLPEQKKIAKILSTWDKAIALQDQLIKEKQALKKGLMQQLLTGKKRFEGFEEEWNEVSLEEQAKVTMGQSPDSESYNEKQDGLWLIQGNADIKNRKSAPRIWTNRPTKVCDIGDILMTVRAPVGAVAKSGHKACIGRGVCSIKPKERNNFIYFKLLYLEKSWLKYQQGSTFSAVSSKDIRNLKIKVPKGIEEQQKIASVLSGFDKEIEHLKEHKKAFIQQKQGLMQQLLSGEKRVKV